MSVHRISRLESEGYKLDPEPQKRCRNASSSQSQRAVMEEGMICGNVGTQPLVSKVIELSQSLT